MGWVKIPKRTVAVTPTITASSAYAALDQLGGVNEVQAGGEFVTLDSIVLLDKSDSGAEILVHFFSSEPTPTSVDHGAMQITDAEMEKYVGTVSVGTTSFDCDADSAKATVETNVGLPMDLTSGKCWAVCQSVGTPTYASTADLVFRLCFIMDHAA